MLAKWDAAGHSACPQAASMLHVHALQVTRRVKQQVPVRHREHTSSCHEYNALPFPDSPPSSPCLLQVLQTFWWIHWPSAPT
jgi:hypothetical protein